MVWVTEQNPPARSCGRHRRRRANLLLSCRTLGRPTWSVGRACSLSMTFSVLESGVGAAVAAAGTRHCKTNVPACISNCPHGGVARAPCSTRYQCCGKSKFPCCGEFHSFLHANYILLVNVMHEASFRLMSQNLMEKVAGNCAFQSPKVETPCRDNSSGPPRP